MSAITPHPLLDIFRLYKVYNSELHHNHRIVLINAKKSVWDDYCQFDGVCPIPCWKTYFSINEEDYLDWNLFELYELLLFELL